MEKVIEKLAAFENMYEALLTDIDKTVLSADRLKNMQKTKTRQRTDSCLPKSLS